MKDNYWKENVEFVVVSIPFRCSKRKTNNHGMKDDTQLQDQHSYNFCHIGSLLLNNEQVRIALATFEICFICA